MELQRHNSPPPQCGSARRAFTGKFNEVFCKVKYAPFLGDKFLFVYPEGSIPAKNICSCDKTFYHTGFCRQNGSSSPFASRSSLFVNIAFVSPSQTIRPPAIRITRLQVSRIISRSCDAMIFRCSKSFSI